MAHRGLDPDRSKRGGFPRGSYHPTPVPRVLFLSYHFPPVGGAGVQRAARFVRLLPSFGYQPVCVTGPGEAPATTPPESLDYALDAAAQMIEDEGLDNVFARHRALGEQTRAGIEAIGLEPLAMKIWFAFKHRGRGRPPPASPAQAASTNDMEAVEPAKAPYQTPLLKNSRQTIALCHIKPHATNECPNLALSPLLHPLPWLLPVFTGLRSGHWLAAYSSGFPSMCPNSWDTVGPLSDVYHLPRFV